MIYLFVYGTLKRGQRNHGLLNGQRFIQQARTAPIYRLFDQGEYPCLVKSKAGVSIEGEVYLIDEATLARVDVLEDAPKLYQRKPVALEDFDEPTITYLYQQSVRRFPECGG